MKKVSDHQDHNSGWEACTQPATREFMEEIRALCRKHGLVLIPSFENKESWHDHMLLLPLNDKRERFLIEETVVYFDDDTDTDQTEKTNKENQP